MKVDTRALAARGLAEIALRGASLREVMQRDAPKLADPRDRALLMALLSEGARWWLRFDAAVDGLLEKSLRHKDPAVHALLVLGLVQLEILELQDYAAVAATVEAVRALKRPQLAGLVNAVLRRWQRERSSLLARLDAKAQTRHAHPQWLADALQRDWPAQAEAVMAADNGEPPLMLRINRQRSERDALIEQLRAAGYEAAAHPWPPFRPARLSPRGSPDPLPPRERRCRHAWASCDRRRQAPPASSRTAGSGRRALATAQSRARR